MKLTGFKDKKRKEKKREVHIISYQTHEKAKNQGGYDKKKRHKNTKQEL